MTNHRLAPPSLAFFSAALTVVVALLLPACGSMPGTGGSAANPITPHGSHKFQCHSASPGPCAYAIFNESGGVRETFMLNPGEMREVRNILPRTTFCLAVEKPLDPSKCTRLGLDGKPLQK